MTEDVEYCRDGATGASLCRLDFQGRMTVLHRIVANIAVLIVFLVAQGHAQCPIQQEDDDQDLPPEIATVVDTVLQSQGDEQLLPETGYLSDSRYTSVFFGLALDLPASVDQRIMLPLMEPRQHALLALSFKNGSREGSITITASEPSNPIPQVTEEQRQKAFQAWANRQPQLSREPPDWMMRSGHFYHVENHIGDKYGILYWTKIKNYKLHFEIVTNDKEFLKNAKHAMETIHLYCPHDDGTLTTDDGVTTVLPEGEPYQGPTIPTAHVDARLADKPQEQQIPPGEFNDGVYRNEDLGVAFLIPAGWKLLNPESLRDGKPAATGIAQRTSDFLQACSRSLLQVVKDNQGATTGQTPRMSLRALDPACLSLRGPDTVRDKQGAEELETYLEMLGDFGEVQLVSLLSISDHLFAVYRGTVGERVPGQELADRASEMIFVTRHRKMLLLWALIAAKEADLNAMPQASIKFEGNESVELGPATLRGK